LEAGSRAGRIPPGLPEGAGKKAGLEAGKETGRKSDWVFLTGEPVFLPNVEKVHHLMEETGLRCLGDDMCSSERFFPRLEEISHTTGDGQLETLTEVCNWGFLYLVFAESERRVGLIRVAADGGKVREVWSSTFSRDTTPTRWTPSSWGGKLQAGS
jgi:hypothetical protein